MITRMRARVMWTSVMVLCSLSISGCEKVCEVTAQSGPVHELPGRPYIYTVEAYRNSISEAFQYSLTVNLTCKIAEATRLVRLGVKDTSEYISNLEYLVDCPSTATWCNMSFNVHLSNDELYIHQYIYLDGELVGSVRYGIQARQQISGSLAVESVSRDLLLVTVTNLKGYPTPWVVTPSFQCDGATLNLTELGKSLFIRSQDLVGRHKCTINITNGVEVVQISASDFNITTISTLTTTIATSSAPETNTNIYIVLGVLLGLAILVVICLVAFLCKIKCLKKAPGPNISIHGHAYIQCGDKSQQLITTSTGNQHRSENIQDDDGVVFSPSAPSESLDSIVVDGANLQLQTIETQELNDMTSVAVQEDLPLDKIGVLDQCRG